MSNRDMSFPGQELSQLKLAPSMTFVIACVIAGTWPVTIPAPSWIPAVASEIALLTFLRFFNASFIFSVASET